MRLGGLHHITMITGDARANVEFYADVLGLRMVKKTVNFDAPQAYHLYFGDEQGTPGSILTWFEFAGAPPGRAGAGMMHTIELGVASEEAIEFWAGRLAARGYDTDHIADGLSFADYDGLRFELTPGANMAAGADGPPLRAVHPEIPAEHAITGILGARAYAHDPGQAEPLLTDTLGFSCTGEGHYRLDGELRRFRWTLEDPPEPPGRQGAGTVHHVAWSCRDEDHLAWRDRVLDTGAYVTEVKDRDYFRSIYFREPRGVLFEIATLSPGFAADEDPDRLGEELRIPRMHAHLRGQLERTLTPLVNPRTTRRDEIAG